MIKFFRRRGQAVVEFALILPIFVLILLATIYLGMFILDYVTLDAAASYAARYVAVHGEDSEFTTKVHDKVQSTTLLLPFYKIAADSPKAYAESDANIVTYMIKAERETTNTILEWILPEAFTVKKSAYKT